MQFGLFYEWPNPGLRDWKRLFEEGMEQIQYSEEMGFDYVLVAEHHFSNYGQTPAPLLQATHIASRTRRLKIATGILVLPIWQPLRLAEEIAVLDNLSGGRFIAGIGRGYQPHEFARFGVTPEESRERFNEALDILIKAWTCDESFTYEGKYNHLPHDTVVWPKPLQKPHPPFWLAGTSPDSIELAAERDMGLLVSAIGGFTAVREAASLWAHARERVGRPLAGLQLGAQTMVSVGDTEEEARANVRYPRWQNRAGRSLNRLEVEHGRVQVTPYPGEADDAAFWDRLFFGTPDRVISQFKRLAECGVTFTSNWMMFGGIEHEKVMKSIRLMGEEVLPALRDVQPPAGLLEQLAHEAASNAALAAAGPAPSG